MAKWRIDYARVYEHHEGASGRKSRPHAPRPKGRGALRLPITELFGLAPSTVSKHLSILYQAGLAEFRKDGRWIYYRLAAKGARPSIRRALEWVAQSVDGDEQVALDAARLKKIQAIDPVELCKRQCRK